MGAVTPCLKKKSDSNYTQFNLNKVWATLNVRYTNVGIYCLRQTV